MRLQGQVGTTAILFKTPNDPYKQVTTVQILTGTLGDPHPTQEAYSVFTHTVNISILRSSTRGLAANVLLFIKVAIRMWWVWNSVLSQMILVWRRSHARIKGSKHNVALSNLNSTQTYFLLLESS